MMLPFLIFSGLLIEKSTAVHFFLPVIVVYSVQRGGLICGGMLLLSAILIACFAGAVRQPTRIHGSINERRDTNG